MWTAHIGGIGRIVIDLAKAQKEKKQIVSVLLGKKEGEFLEEFKCFHIPIFSANLNSGYDLSLVKILKTRKIIAKYDILHVHVFHPAIALCTYFIKNRVVYTMHGLPLTKDEMPKRKIFSEFVKKVYLNKKVDLISFNSRFTKTGALKLYGLKKTNYEVVYNGTNLMSGVQQNWKFCESIQKKCKDKFVIACFARFNRRKRLDRLVEGFNEFFLNKKALLLLVGDGPMRKNLEVQVIKSSLKDDVVFTGFQNNVNKFMNIMDICVCPSENEPFGLVAIESLSAGKPIIVFSDGGGITEIIERIEPKDIVGNSLELAQRLTYYYNNRKEIYDRFELRRKYVQNFSIDKMARSFISIYEQLLKL
jgi:glycosyltransferase involved in cell wall biosynthesis